MSLWNPYWHHPKDKSSYPKDPFTLPQAILPRLVVVTACLPPPRLQLRPGSRSFSIFPGDSDWGCVVATKMWSLSRGWELTSKDACRGWNFCEAVIDVFMDKFLHTTTTAGSVTSKVCVDRPEKIFGLSKSGFSPQTRKKWLTCASAT